MYEILTDKSHLFSAGKVAAFLSLVVEAYVGDDAPLNHVAIAHSAKRLQYFSIASYLVPNHRSFIWRAFTTANFRTTITKDITNNPSSLFATASLDGSSYTLSQYARRLIDPMSAEERSTVPHLPPPVTLTDSSLPFFSRKP